MEWPKISSGGRPGRRKPELRSAALCATCCSSVYSCASHSKDTQRLLKWMTLLERLCSCL